MVKFTHMADVHLGGWRQEKMRNLNFESFQFAIKKSIDRKVNFVIIAGDLFDSAYPPIEILKETFAEFRKLKEAKIPVFIIAGSHDYSVSGKSFLDVLEKAGFCTNVHNSEDIDNVIHLHPTIHEGIAFYGYPGKKSGLEVKDLRRIKLTDAPGMMKIVLLHTTLDKVRGVLPIDCLEADNLPKADYYALGHIHVDFRYKNIVYPGPVFPNNFSELETLHNGTFYIIDTDDDIPFEKIEEGKQSDINFQKIEDVIIEKGAYFVLRNTHNLKSKEIELDFEIKNKENLEGETVEKYSSENPSKFNYAI